MTQVPEPDSGLDAQLDRLLEPSLHPQARGSVDFPRLEALLAAAAAPDPAGPQPGEQVVLAAFRELVTEPSGTPSLAARRARQRMYALVAATSTVAVLGSGIAAAATGSLPGAAQSTAKAVLGVIGVSVPGPNGHAGDHPAQRGRSGDTPQPGAQPTDGPEPVDHPSGLSQGQPPTPGNSGVSRHHGNPTPKASGHPAPGHGKPAAAPTVAHRRSTPSKHAVRPTHLPSPNVRALRVMHSTREAISR